MMTNQFIAKKLKQINNEKILSLLDQTKNQFPADVTPKNKIVFKIKFNTPIKRINIKKFRKFKTKGIVNLSKISLNDYSFENNKNNFGFINYKLTQQNSYFFRSHKLKNNISNLTTNCNEKNKLLPRICKSFFQPHEKYNLKKIYLGDLSKNMDEDKISKKDNLIISTKSNTGYKKYDGKNKIKKLSLIRNSTDYELNSNNNMNIEQTHRNAKLLKKYYIQKLMNYDRLIKRIEEETQVKKKVMNEYIKLMKEDLENSFIE